MNNNIFAKYIDKDFFDKEFKAKLNIIQILAFLEKEGLTTLNAMKLTSACTMKFLTFLLKNYIKQEDLYEYIKSENLEKILFIVNLYIESLKSYYNISDLITHGFDQHEKLDNLTKEWIKKTDLSDLDITIFNICMIIMLSMIPPENPHPKLGGFISSLMKENPRLGIFLLSLIQTSMI